MNLEKRIEKLHFSISEVAELVGVKAYVLRYWETEFRQLNPQKNNAGVRRYSKEDIEFILKIKDLLYEKKFTIKGARDVIQKNARPLNATELDSYKEIIKEYENQRDDTLSELISIGNDIRKLIKYIDH